MKKLIAKIIIVLFVFENILLGYFLYSFGLITLPWGVVNNIPTSFATTPPLSYTNTLATPKWVREELVKGLFNPWDIAFITETQFIFTERGNRISYYNNGELAILNSPEDTYVRGEGGMLSLAIDPEFQINNYLYTCFNSNLSGTADIRVVRWVFDGKQLKDRKDIITGMPSNSSGRHSGCQLEFGPDKNLWVGTGDAAIGAHPMDPKSLGGKILRVDKEGGPVFGNLGSPFDPRIFSYGHRNVQGIAFMPSQNAQGVIGFSSEHGPGVDDEVNPLVPGNFGWNPVPGYNEGVPMTDSVKYPDAILSTWTSGNPTQAVSGITIIKGQKWGSYDGALALAIQRRTKIKVLFLDSNGKVIKDEDTITDIGRIRTIQSSPENNLFVLTDNGSGKDVIYKITPGT